MSSVLGTYARKAISFVEFASMLKLWGIDIFLLIYKWAVIRSSLSRYLILLLLIIFTLTSNSWFGNIIFLLSVISLTVGSLNFEFILTKATFHQYS